MVITLRRAAVCADCGAALAIGTSARWYRSGKVYGLSCHEPAPPAERAARRSRGRSAPVCEDAPCCGCCDGSESTSVGFSGDYRDD